MLSLFTRPAITPLWLPVSRFGVKAESKKIYPLVDQLLAKQIELKNSADSLGVESSDHEKYVILTRILNNIKRSVAFFNSKETSTDPICELQQLVTLMRELAGHIKAVTENKEQNETLSRFRNNNRAYAQTALSVGMWGGIGTAFAISSLAGVSVLVVGSLGMNCLVDNATDMRSPISTTAELLMQILEILEAFSKKTISSINAMQLPDSEAQLSDTDNMVCPFTKTIIKDPYIFVLDGYSYEKEALIERLKLFRASSLNGKTMKPNQVIDDVIFPNRSLKAFLEDYRMRQAVGAHNFSR